MKGEIINHGEEIQICEKTLVINDQLCLNKEAVTDHLKIDARVRNSQTSEAVDLSGNAIGDANAVAAGDNTLWMFEGQFGLEYKRDLVKMPGTAYFRFGLEYQYWDFPESVADIRGRVGSMVLPNFLPEVTGGMGLTGFVVSTGINY